MNNNLPTYREATTADIPQMMEVRFAVKENVLSNPALVTPADCEEYINQRGKGWVCEVGKEIVGFAIADLQENSIWALFVHPDYAEQGIGKALHKIVLDWYFAQTISTIWLSTSPATRAERFYIQQGWRAGGDIFVAQRFKSSKAPAGRHLDSA
ncbi:MAG: GNAT family N-acetyltransferase [Bacteroidetes bacterium]|nr:MAG: GNAT family N-acetyltransferase [Bacteroidota bacterium]